MLEKLISHGELKIYTLFVNDLDNGPYISDTMRLDESIDELSARVVIYRMMRPGEPPTPESVNYLFESLFYSNERYDLSNVGRMKFNFRAYPEFRDEKSAEWLQKFYSNLDIKSKEHLSTLM